IRLPRAHQVEMAAVVQRLSEASGAEVSSEAIHAAFVREYLEPGSEGLIEFALTPAAVERGGGWKIDAGGSVGGGRRSVSGSGNGPIAAFAHALGRAVGAEVQVLDYTEHAVETGADASAVAYVEVALGPNGPRACGAGRHGDIVTASLRAVVSA